MDEEGCHVETEWVTISADTSTCPSTIKPTDLPLTNTEPTACTMEARPSVLVDVAADVDGHLVPIGADRVFFEWSGDKGGREWPGTCLDADCTQFAAGREQEGRFQVSAEVCGSVVNASVEVEKTDDGCHVETQHVVLTANTTKCEDTPDLKEPDKKECTLEARPSAFVFPVTDGGDVWIPSPTDQLWYENGKSRYQAFCAIEAENGKCSWWVAGYEQSGRFEVHTETCGAEQSVAFEVPMTEDGCHVQTQYIPVFMDTKGCITHVPPGVGEPPAPSGGPH
jgi:hypothetical protein